MDFSLLFIIKHYIIVVLTVRLRNVGLCTNMGCLESRVRMTYVKSAAEIKKYSQALRGVQVGQGNLSVPGDTKTRKLSLFGVQLGQGRYIYMEEKTKYQIWFVWSKYTCWQQRRDKFDVQRTNLLFCQGITLSTRHHRGEGARFMACWWKHYPENRLHPLSAEQTHWTFFQWF